MPPGTFLPDLCISWACQRACESSFDIESPDTDGMWIRSSLVKESYVIQLIVEWTMAVFL
jgi:hypothetical protein